MIVMFSCGSNWFLALEFLEIETFKRLNFISQLTMAQKMTYRLCENILKNML